MGTDLGPEMLTGPAASDTAERLALRALLDVNALLLTARQPQQVEQALTHRVLRLMASRYAYFLRYDPETDELTVTTVAGEEHPDTLGQVPRPTALGRSLLRGQGLSWQAVEYTATTGESVLYVPRDRVPEGAVRVGVAPDQHLLYATLRTLPGELLGVLTLGRLAPAFTEQDRDLLAAFANAGTLALERSREERRAAVAREGTMLALGLALEARDYETQGHTARTVALAGRLGQRLGLSDEELEALRQGAYLHDLGKLNVPDSVLLKPGPLSLQERQVIQAHTVTGEALARRVASFKDGALTVVRSHHERWDGSGYPDRLAGTDIPLLARLFAVVDVYDALTHDRPYRRAYTVQEARKVLQAGEGSHFDPRVLKVFLTLLDEEGTHSG